MWRVSGQGDVPSSPPLFHLPCPAVTASQVPGSGGALALYLLPRFLLINTLDVPIQYKQQVRTACCTADCTASFPAIQTDPFFWILGRCTTDMCAGRADLLLTGSPLAALCACVQGTLLERELTAGASRALRWADALRALRLCVRVQEAGWMWSGGFELDSPGDMFIKIRWVLTAGSCCSQ